jgi:hypothetical protein
MRRDKGRERKPPCKTTHARKGNAEPGRSATEAQQNAQDPAIEGAMDAVPLRYRYRHKALQLELLALLYSTVLLYWTWY